jgi:hypothetical protein
MQAIFSDFQFTSKFITGKKRVYLEISVSVCRYKYKITIL